MRLKRAGGERSERIPCSVVADLPGGHVRVSLEDNIYLVKGQLAPSNAALVEKAGRIIELLGDSVATAHEARGMLAVAGAA